MGALATTVRRLIWLVLIGAVGGGGYAWWRDRQRDDELAPAEWPPLTPQSDTAKGSAGVTADPALGNATMEPDAAPTANSITDLAAADDSSSAETSGTTSIIPDHAAPGSDSAGASDVNPLVDTPQAQSDDSENGEWIQPLDDGSCPISHPVKANDNSGIFHVPDGRFYERTHAERCYTTPEAAAADGYRRAKS